MYKACRSVSEHVGHQAHALTHAHSQVKYIDFLRLSCSCSHFLSLHSDVI